LGPAGRCGILRAVIHVALPAYNEDQNIGPLLEELCHTFADTLPGRRHAIGVVDDGSADETAQAVRDFIAHLDRDRFPLSEIELVQHEVNRGLAEAIRTGLTTCADRAEPRDIILTMDADNSHLPGLVPSMVRKIYEGHDVCIASRYQRGARVLGLTWDRKLLSLGASALFQLLFPIPGVRDYTCGFRAYRAGMLQEVFASSPEFFSEQGFTVMVDILLKLRRRDPPVLMTEVPLLLRYDFKKGASKMNVGETVKGTFALMGRRLLGR
jgi:dolichol-phosphate mannosyltransferase